ncbi:hypothetical protein [Actinomadura sp. 6N118]|uniref:hypothetical protein n=1 Tax=Actinomadura sp. 6N118 TaxID=3375151 RepID=UPI0037BB1DEA
MKDDYETPLDWDDANREHATRRVSETEINQIFANRDALKIESNSGELRSGDYIAYGITDGGKRVAVVFQYPVITPHGQELPTPRPITAWELKT